MKEQRETLNNQWHELDKKNGILADSMKNIKSVDLPQIYERLTSIQHDIATNFKQSWCENIGNTYFYEEQRKHRPKVLQEYFKAAIDKKINVLNSIRKSLRERRSAYNSKYNMAFDVVVLKGLNLKIM